MSLQLLQSPAVVFGPAFIVAAFAILAIPSLMVPGAKAEGVVKAIACYILKTLGLVLLALSAVQLMYGLIVMQMPDFPSLAALIILFTVGVGLMVHESTVLKHIDEASVMIPRLVFSHACEIIGAIICILSTLSLVVTYIVSEGSPEGIAGWELSATLLLLGAIMSLGSSVHIGHRNKKAARSMKAKRK
jgi:hypothetical protein